jgi:hypothetical protein
MIDTLPVTIFFITGLQIFDWFSKIYRWYEMPALTYEQHIILQLTEK